MIIRSNFRRSKVTLVKRSKVIFIRRSKVSKIFANLLIMILKVFDIFHVENPLVLTVNLLIVLLTNKFFRRSKVKIYF